MAIAYQLFAHQTVKNFCFSYNVEPILWWMLVKCSVICLKLQVTNGIMQAMVDIGLPQSEAKTHVYHTRL